MIVIELESKITVNGLPDFLKARFVSENRFNNPKFDTLLRLGKWTGKTPRIVSLVDILDDGGIRLPRGYYRSVVKALNDNGLRFEVRDLTVCPPTAVPCDGFNGELYPYQAEALADLLRRPTGVLEAPTGSGKTNILLSTVPHLQTNVLILVHTVELLNQTVDRCRSWLGIEPGVIGAGKEKLGQVTVGMIQTLARRDLREIRSYFGGVLVDECHHSPAFTWARLLNQLPARYRYGFTATAWRKDGFQFLMWRVIGDKSARITRQGVEAVGRMVWPRVESVGTDYYYDIKDAGEWPRMIADLSRDPERNGHIEREVRRRVTPDSHALILTDRIEHANILADRLADLRPVLITGQLSKVERRRAISTVRAGARLTIATIHLLGEGIDVPGWDLLFLVSPISGGPRTLQAIGRVSRPAPNKDRALVVDFVDAKVDMLYSAWKRRQSVYR